MTEKRARDEIAFILSQLELPVGARILDVGCGFGRHSIELARLGYDVTGIDPSAAMIADAQERARKMAVSVTFQQIPAEQFSTTARFEAAICLFTTLGQISAKDDNRSLLQTVYGVLKPGGKIVVEVPQRETAVAQLKPSERYGSGERTTAVTRQYDPKSKVIREEFLVVMPQRKQSFLLRYRLFSFSELSGLLTDAGYEITSAFGDYVGTPLTRDSSTMLLTGKK